MTVITRTLSVGLLVASVVLLASTIGHAYCFGNLEIQMRCQNDQGCDYVQTVSRCFEEFGGMTNCSVSYGLCCGNEAHWDSASGEICGEPKKAPLGPKAGASQYDDGVAFARLYVPDKCRGGYGILTAGIDLLVGR